MARGGISKEQVRIARQSILARGFHPSIDAVRLELGNTGSKSTIHRLLKELESEDLGATQGPLPLSEELGELVIQLAARLQQEARAAVAEDRARLSRERLDHQQLTQGAQQRITDLQAQSQSLMEQLRESRELAAQLQLQKHQVELSNARLRQAAGDLEARLRERDVQIAALDQARIAAEQAHQEELTRLSRDNERLLTEARLQRKR